MASDTSDGTSDKIIDSVEELESLMERADGFERRKLNEEAFMAYYEALDAIIGENKIHCTSHQSEIPEPIMMILNKALLRAERLQKNPQISAGRESGSPTKNPSHEGPEVFKVAVFKTTFC